MRVVAFIHPCLSGGVEKARIAGNVALASRIQFAIARSKRQWSARTFPRKLAPAGAHHSKRSNGNIPVHHIGVRVFVFAAWETCLEPLSGRL